MDLSNTWFEALADNPKNDESNKDLREIREVSSEESSVEDVIECLLAENTLVVMIKSADGGIRFLHHPSRFGRTRMRSSTKYVALHGISVKAVPVVVPFEEAFQSLTVNAPTWTALRALKERDKVSTTQPASNSDFEEYSLRHAQILPPFLSLVLMKCGDHNPAALYVEALNALEEHDSEIKHKSDCDLATSFCREVLVYLWLAAQETNPIKGFQLDPADASDITRWSHDLHQQFIKPENLVEAAAADGDKGNSANDDRPIVRVAPGHTNESTSRDAVKKTVQDTSVSKGHQSSTANSAEDAETAASSSSPSSKKKTSQFRTWEESYNRLVAYKSRFGNVNVPRDWKEDPSLAEWTRQQRRKQKALPPDQFLKLDELGMVWGHALEERNNKLWEESFKHLQEYKGKFGSANPPRIVGKEDEYQDLSRWAVSQRQQYKRGLLSEDRKNRLAEIGFEFKIRRDYMSKGRPKDEKNWHKQYDHLVALKNETGHCNPPKIYPPCPSLHNFCYTQRKCYKEDRLDEDRKKLLEDIGFVWNLGDSQREELWMEQYNKLKAFYNRFGHLEIPRSGPNNDPPLLKWARRQREALRCEKLSSSRKALLDELGFDFESDLQVRKKLVQEQYWKDKYDELSALKEKRGEIEVIDEQEHADLVKWIKKQRRLDDLRKLDSARKTLLEELGIKFHQKAVKKPGKTKGASPKSRKRKADEGAADGAKSTVATCPSKKTKGSRSRARKMSKSEGVATRSREPNKTAAGTDEASINMQGESTDVELSQSGSRRRKRTATLGAAGQKK